MLDSVFICKYSVRYTLASSSVSGFLSVACDGGSNPYPHLNKQVNHSNLQMFWWLNTPHIWSSMYGEFIVSYYLTVILNSLQRFVKDLVPIQYRYRVFRFPKYQQRMNINKTRVLKPHSFGWNMSSLKTAYPEAPATASPARITKL